MIKLKIFREIILKLCALVVFIISMTLILGSVNFINLNKISDTIITFIFNNEMYVLGGAALVSILSLIAIFITIQDKNEIKTGVAIKREAGNVYISRETFESIVINVVRSYASLKNYKVFVVVAEEGITASILTYILPDTVVPVIMAKLQEDVKNAILKQTTVELKEVNVKIKGVYSQADRSDKTVS